MRTSLWDIVFVVTTVFGALIGAVCFAIVVRNKNLPYSNVAAVAGFLFSVAAVLFFWRFL